MASPVVAMTLQLQMAYEEPLKTWCAVVISTVSSVVDFDTHKQLISHHQCYSETEGQLSRLNIFVDQTLL